MPRPPQTEIRMRLIVENPVPGVAHSLQDKANRPVDIKFAAAGEPLTFDFAIRVADGPKFFGEQVRSEGPERRFVYVAIGTLAGDPYSAWTRRMKIDIHTIAPDLIEAAVAGKRLQGSFAGTAADGSPACATIRPVSWHAR
jgi:hypothetical protein